MPIPAGTDSGVPTLPELKRQLNRPQEDASDDAELQLYLSAAIESVEAILGGPVQVTEVTEAVRPNRKGLLLLTRQPVVDVLSVSVAGAPLAAAAYEADEGAATIALGTWRDDLYTVVYEAGYDILQASFRLAILIIAQHLWRTQHGGARNRGGDDQVMMPGLGFAIPSRAAELLRPATVPAVA